LRLQRLDVKGMPVRGGGSYNRTPCMLADRDMA
jgi:hypothetical protein